MHKKIIGIDPRSHTDVEGIKAAGIEWVRQGFSFPFQDKLYGERSESYRRDVELARGFVQQGLKVMGITPLAGVRAFDSAKDGAYWQSWLPDWVGPLGSATYQQTYELACAEIARETADLIDLWQIGNEMDIELFRGPLTLEEAVDFMVAGARGVKQGNPKARTSINPAELSEEAIWFFQKLYANGQNLFDYAGIDGYWGSWSPGGPNTFREAIDHIYAITQVPVLFHEWGYTSLGGAPRPKVEGQSFCEAGGFWYVWKQEHSPNEQTEFVQVILKLFAEHPHAAGGFFYNWGDDLLCYHCGQPDCPTECGWGSVDKHGHPKPAYHAFQAAVQKYYL